ncbi:MAG: hypothetical protein AAF621_02295 [Pseudomonadota bacterium]
MRKEILAFLISPLIVTAAIVTFIYENTVTDRDVRYQKPFKDFGKYHSAYQKIVILQDDLDITLRKKGKKWLITSQDNHLADTKKISRILNWISSFEIIAKKTSTPKLYPRIGLANPSPAGEKNIEGSGTRIMIYGGQKAPLFDVIVGDILRSYKMRDKNRFFARYGNKGAFLIESLPLPDFNRSAFFDRSQIGFPAFEDISRVTTYLSGEKQYQLKALTDKKDGSIAFYPETIPIGKRLLYPNIGTDFVHAVLHKISPFGAAKVDYNDDIAPNHIVLTRRNGHNIMVNFRRSQNDIYYMVVLHDGLDKTGKIYAYRIPEKDYKGVLQPFSAFLTDDVTQQQN